MNNLPIAAAAYVAYVDGRPDGAAVLFGARLGLSPLTLPPRFRPIVGALEKHGLQGEIAAGAKINADAALERAIEVISASPPAPA